MKHLSALLLLLLVASKGMNAQPFQLVVAPRTQPLVLDRAECTARLVVDASFHASIFLRASTPTLPRGTVTLSNTLLNEPYSDTIRISVKVSGITLPGVYPVVVEAWNASTISRDTVTVTVSDVAAPWRVFNTHNSNFPVDTATGVLSLAVDRDGHLWAGTLNGPAMWLDTSWAVHNDSTGFPFKFKYFMPSRIAIDSSGGVWASTNYGYARYVRGQWEVKKDIPYSYGSNVGVGLDGTIWIASDKMLRTIDTLGNNITTYPLEGGSALNMAIDHQGKVWATYRTFDGTYWTARPDVGEVKNINVDDSGNVWLVSSLGLIKFENGGSVRRTIDVAPISNVYPGSSPTALLFGADGTIWVGNENGLIRHKGSDTWFYNRANSGLPSNYITQLAETSDGRVWIGLREGGIAVIDGTAPPATLFVSGVSNNRVADAAGSAITSIVPNPVRDEARISYNMHEPGRLRLSLVDNLGREVATLFDRDVEGGRGGITVATSGYAPGVYLLRMTASGTTTTESMVIVR